ncbi:Rho guanine nucleotide exchange factor scd1 [Apiospora rasikravindrae]|uniref:Rho guanine nucleotide exchange factor scd1 n=1 Tax=Apiospora rasikravindrae TaxID=990691 RepID=A0ABR1T5X0_9PEZI
MDPLSITASVAGLLTAAAKINSLLDAIASAKNAPKTIQNAQNEVRHVELTLRSLRRYLWQLELVDTRRRELICLDEVIVPLADAMLELSDFETRLNKLTNLTKHRAYISWGSYSKSVEEHLARITRQTTSLIMILNILQCESDLEAFQSQQSLHLLVGEILSENKVLKGKLEHLEVSVDARSMLTSRPDTELRSMSHGTAADIDDDAATIRGMSRQTSQRSTVRVSRQGTLEFAFEKVLEHSWVYKRNANNNCDASFVSSVQRSYAWSVFSEYSLADISILSVIAMPITTLDVSNGIYYIAGKEDAAQEEGDRTHAGGSNSSPRILSCQKTKNSQQPEYEPRVLGNGSQEGTLEEAHEFSRCKGCGEVNEEKQNPLRIIEEDDVFGFGKLSVYIIDAKSGLLNGRLAENRWHLNCFCCQSCSRLLDTDTDFRLVSESSLLCSGCMYSCATCGNKIEDLALVNDETI